MHDIKTIKADPDAFDRAMKRRGEETRAADLIKRDEARVANTVAMNEAQARQKQASKGIGQAKASGDEAAAQAAMAEVAGLKAEVKRLEEAQRGLDEALREALLPIPNVMDDDVPDGADESDNVELRRWGTPADIPDARDHVDLGEALGMMDFEAAAKLSGSRFVVLKRDLAKLERALATFMLGLHTEEFGYEEVAPPVIVREPSVRGTGQLPKFGDDLFLAEPFAQIEYNQISRQIAYHLETNAEISASMSYSDGIDALQREIEQRAVNAELDNTIIEQLIGKSVAGKNVRRREEYDATKQLVRDLMIRRNALPTFGDDKRFLTPTAEVTLTNLVADTILAEDALPRRFTAWTQCFRAEAGSAGRDTRGMIRLHQFSKVELVSITTPEASDAEHERMTGCAEEVLTRLDLPFRTMLLCSGDTGFGAAKTYDLEVWLPGQGQYREISSCSNTRGFQARRMNARYKKEGEKKPQHVHTLNGSGLAVGRTLLAVLENYQQPDGSIAVPDVLVPLMGKDRITA